MTSSLEACKTCSLPSNVSLLPAVSVLRSCWSVWLVLEDGLRNSHRPLRGIPGVLVKTTVPHWFATLQRCPLSRQFRALV
eukprot:826033-Ditylum_brightwellii.AAC.1